MKTDRSKTPGNPEEAFSLATNLVRAFRESKLYKQGSSSHHFAFDVMVGIAYFTSIVLKTLEVSAPSKIDICKIYSEEILAEFCKDDTVESMIQEVLKSHEQSIVTN